MKTNPLGPPHPELLKYFEPPKKVLKRSQDALEECKTAFKIKEVPKKETRKTKAGHVHAKDDDDEDFLLDKPLAHAQLPTKKPAVDGSDTEDSDDDMLGLPSKENRMSPSPVRSVSPVIDPGRAPGRIIGTTYPLEDFKKNISQGDLVSKAVEDLRVAIKEIVLRPFASRRRRELLDCMRILRDTCLTVRDP